MSRKVVLFYPPYEGTPLGAPLCLLALTATLRAHGFEPMIIGAAVVIPIWPKLCDLGVEEPRTVKQWGEMALGVNMLPWLQDVNFARFNRMLDYFLIDRQVDRTAKAASCYRQFIRTMLAKPVGRRIGHGRYSFPWEIWLSRLVEHLVKRRSLIDGREQPTEAVNVC